MSLDAVASTILGFTWNTSGVPPDSYYVTAEAVLPEDEDPNDNIARTLIGGIFAPWHKPETNILTLLVPLALVVLFVIASGITAMSFFKILMSVRTQWPWRYHESSRASKQRREKRSLRETPPLKQSSIKVSSLNH